MLRSLFWFSDQAWTAVEPHLPHNQPGARRVDDRRVISGIVHMLKSGGRWADCPAEYRPSTTVYNRWNPWSRRGIWARILTALIEESWITETGQIDSSYVKAHRSAAGHSSAWGDDLGIITLRDERGPVPLASRVAVARARSMHLSMSLDDRFGSP